MTVSDFASSASWGYSQTVGLPAGEFSAAFAAEASGTSGTALVAGRGHFVCREMLDILEQELSEISGQMALARAAQENGDTETMRGHLQYVRDLAAGAATTCTSFEAYCGDEAGGLSPAEIASARRMCQQIDMLGQQAGQMLFELDQKGARGVNLEPMMNLLSNIVEGLGGLVAAFGGALGWFLQQLVRRPGAV